MINLNGFLLTFFCRNIYVYFRKVLFENFFLKNNFDTDLRVFLLDYKTQLIVILSHYFLNKCICRTKESSHIISMYDIPCFMFRVLYIHYNKLPIQNGNLRPLPTTSPSPITTNFYLKLWYLWGKPKWTYLEVRSHSDWCIWQFSLRNKGIRY